MAREISDRTYKSTKSKRLKGRKFTCVLGNKRYTIDKYFGNEKNIQQQNQKGLKI